MAHVGEHDWRGFRPDGPSATDLFDPAKLEARLVEARVRRAKALAARTEGKVVAPNPTSPLPLGRRGDRTLGGLLFLGGLALGSVGAVVATQAILGSAASPPMVVALAGAPSWQGLPIPLAEASVLQSGLDPPSPSLPVLAVVAAEPDPELPKPLAWVGAAPSKVRGAWTVTGTPPSLRLFTVQPQVSVVRATLDAAAPLVGDEVVGLFDSTLGSDNYPGMPPVGLVLDEPGVARPDRPQEPSGPGSQPRPSEPPTTKPPTATPKPPPVAIPKPPPVATPKPPPTATPKPPTSTLKPNKPEKGGVREPKPARPSAGRSPVHPGSNAPDRVRGHPTMRRPAVAVGDRVVAAATEAKATEAAGATKRGATATATATENDR